MEKDQIVLLEDRGLLSIIGDDSKSFLSQRSRIESVHRQSLKSDESVENSPGFNLHLQQIPGKT